ncbi:DUF2496 domain-containing protein [Psychrobium sp. 1_MG-2023]|uniref:DUF2496 domain-containing protein n=1 Tax=Psychrobium sp. 1_MG-2023 TaxID=3062624 RepID=UPI00273240FF|nr:DUF2496 domain-containing protein [Psychrobium sp. 1_MG-2023]MDP2559949.1 DUF2496 domain-containing protein [Psychrobium sp. 1_MG-2023]
MSDTSPLEQAPDHIKLAVDLIQILEESEVNKEVAIKALHIVLTDLQREENN